MNKKNFFFFYFLFLFYLFLFFENNFKLPVYCYNDLTELHEVWDDLIINNVIFFCYYFCLNFKFFKK
jgi:hypothetical protein